MRNCVELSVKNFLTENVPQIQPSQVLVPVVLLEMSPTHVLKTKWRGRNVLGPQRRICCVGWPNISHNWLFMKPDCGAMAGMHCSH